MTAAAETASVHDAGEAGFTLVELLVAIALLGILNIALFGSLRFGVSAWGRGTARADAAAEIPRKIFSTGFLPNPTHYFCATSGAGDTSISTAARNPSISSLPRRWRSAPADARGSIFLFKGEMTDWT
jgi:prepilin-type N-terminal cleavage/methylation domain-containing protein